MKRLRHALEAALVYFIYGVFRLFSLQTASAMGGSLGRAIGRFLPSSNTARQNLKAAFPEKSEAEIETIVGSMWENAGRVMAEYAHLDDIWQTTTMHGIEHLLAAQDSQKPTIFFTAHIANWETCPISARKYGVEMHTVYRRPNNPWVANLLNRARNSGSAGLIAKGREGAREMLSVLKKNGVLGIMMDQKMNEGMPIPFFGRDAMTADAIAAFALRFDCRVHPVRVERVDGAHFIVTVAPPMALPKTGNRKDDMRQLLTDINHHIEGWVRARPEQWTWMHKRWPD